MGYTQKRLERNKTRLEALLQRANAPEYANDSGAQLENRPQLLF